MKDSNSWKRMKRTVEATATELSNKGIEVNHNTKTIELKEGVIEVNLLANITYLETKGYNTKIRRQ